MQYINDLQVLLEAQIPSIGTRGGAKSGIIKINVVASTRFYYFRYDAFVLMATGDNKLCTKLDTEYGSTDELRIG